MTSTGAPASHSNRQYRAANQPAQPPRATPGYSVLGCFERLLGQARMSDGRRIHRENAWYALLASYTHVVCTICAMRTCHQHANRHRQATAGQRKWSCA